MKVLGALAVLGLLAAACAADVILFFMRAGEVLGGLELLAIVLLGAAALALTALRPRYWLCALPIVAFVVFRTGVVDLVPVPRDAVLRDAQAGLSVVVVVGAQMLLVPLGLGLASLIGNPPRTGI